MKNLPKTAGSTNGKRKVLGKTAEHAKDAYTHHTSVNGNIDTRRKNVKPRGKKV